MEHALNILKRELQHLENGYNKFVINGSVKPESDVAKENRKKATEIQNAITELNKQAESEQLVKHDVSQQREQLIAFLRNQNKLHYITIYENDFDFADKLLKAINCG